MATWYAQSSSVNIESDSLWNSAADGSGSALTWANLGASDILEANGKTALAITADLTCGQLQTLSGGGFTVSLATANRRIAANLLAGTTTCLTRSSTTYTLTIGGNVTGGSAANACGLAGTDANGTIIEGGVTGGSASSAFGVGRGAIYGVMSVGGTVTAGTAGAAIEMSYQGTATITGNLVASGAIAAVVPYSDYYTLVLSGSIVCSALGVFPCRGASGVRIKWSGASSGATISMRDSSLVEKIAKVPDYPAAADVKSGVAFDYTTKTGTLSSGGGGPIIGCGFIRGAK